MRQFSGVNPRQLDVVSTAEDYRVNVSSFRAAGQFYARIRIERIADKRIIFPFDGSEVPGPFDSSDLAREAGVLRAHQLVEGDIRYRE
jgi:hypothetical protein